MRSSKITIAEYEITFSKLYQGREDDPVQKKNREDNTSDCLLTDRLILSDPQNR